MSRKQRMQNAREAKDRKMKKVLVGLSVVLVAVLAFEVPKMMHSGNSSSTPPAATTTAGASTTPASATPALGTAAAAVTPVASTKLPNSDPAPHAAKSQLYSFSHFSGKDPFVQQINTSTTPSGSSSGTSSTKPQTPTGQTVAVRRNQSSRTLAVTGAASIAVNGRIQVVRVGTSFPSANPLFRLVSVTHGVARIGIASGSYTSGAQTVSLTLGRTLTLVDTADGVRYRLRLVSAA